MENKSKINMNMKEKYLKSLGAFRSFGLLVLMIGGFVLYYAIMLEQWVLGGFAFLLTVIGGTAILKVKNKLKEEENVKETNSDKKNTK